jgi:hypothetical protein
MLGNSRKCPGRHVEAPNRVRGTRPIRYSTRT